MYFTKIQNITKELNGLMEAMQFFDLKEGFIITQNQKDSLQIKDKTVYLIPAFEYFV